MDQHRIAAVMMTSSRPIVQVAEPARPAPRHDEEFSAVVTDLDGTLLRSDASVSARTRRALLRARASGATHIVATGRPVAECRWLPASLGYRGLAVCGQGGQLYDFGSDTMLWSATVDRGNARDVVETLRAGLPDLLVGVNVSGQDGRFHCTTDFDLPAAAEWHRVSGPEELWRHQVAKVVLRHATLHEDELACMVAAVSGPAFSVTHSFPRTVELLPPGIDKAVGLAHATEHLQLAADDVIAFGDMPNDVSMLEWAGHAVAMGNAHAAVLAIADEVAPSNDEDGVAQILERFFTKE